MIFNDQTKNIELAIFEGAASSLDEDGFEKILADHNKEELKNRIPDPEYERLKGIILTRQVAKGIVNHWVTKINTYEYDDFHWKGALTGPTFKKELTQLLWDKFQGKTLKEVIDWCPGSIFKIDLEMYLKGIG